MDTPEKPIVLPLKEDLKLMINEMYGPFNRRVTGEEVHHEPNANECASHFINHGGVEHFRQTHKIQVAA